MDSFKITFELVEEGVGFGMSEKKDYVLPPEFSSVSPWAGRWDEYFQQKKQSAEQVMRMTKEQKAERAE